MRTSLLIGLLLITAAIYCLGINGPLLFDDSVNLEPLRTVENHLVPWYVVVFTNASSQIGRPISLISFFIDYWLFGFNVVAFKATNILLHIAIGAVIYAFVERLLRSTAYIERRKAIALVTAGCWLLSPLYVSTVLYVVQRMAMLSTLFVLLALWAYLVLREGLDQAKIRWAALGGFCVSALLGVFSKENAVLLPLFVLVLEGFFFKPIENPQGRKLWRWALVILVALPLVATSALIIYKSDGFFDASSRPFTIYERVLTETRILWGYIGSLLLPQSNTFGLFHDDIVLSTNWLTPISTLIASAAWLGVFVVAILVRKSKFGGPIAGGLLFFLAGHLLESSFFPLELYFEHRNYLPGVGVYLALVLIGALLMERQILTAKALKLIAGAYLVVLLIALSQRVLIWERYETIIYSSYQAHPHSPRANVEAAAQDAIRGAFSGAIQKLNTARHLPGASILGVNLQAIWTYCLLDQKGLEKELPALVDEVQLDGTPHASIAMRQINDLLARKRCNNVPYAEAISKISNRIRKYYDSGEYRRPEAIAKGGIDTLQIRVMEALRLTAQSDNAVELANSINRAGKDDFVVNMLKAATLIDLNRLSEAGLLLEQLKADKSMQAQAESNSLASVDAMYQARLNGSNHVNE